jgi:hypothetical protein
MIDLNLSEDLASRSSMTKKKNPNAVALGKLGGSKGGKVRAAKLTPEERSNIARKAVLARWAKAREKAQQKDLRDKA